ncbi:hypothetical protein N4T77_14910 [Clostridium sp. CX1]|uniref:hypothetical protein n=1 Tax=Clostridium sp. CX1 TaxID=2978346 RepID=UPI0021BE9B8F|nr:hypothetical protein [Clostridium sp. CX1]MCT8977888.1 hypothetical protein [Clostridium sp. CX1]
MDKSIFRHGTTLPKDEIYKYFSAVNSEYLQRRENEAMVFSFDMFLKTIATSNNGIRSASIKMSPDYKNIITLDFIVEFYRDIVKEPKSIYINKLQSFSEDDFYQNQMFKEYFHLIENDGQIDKAIEKYFSFIRLHLDYKVVNNEDNNSKKPKLAMPYEIFVPLDGDENQLYKYLLVNKYISSSEKYVLEYMEVNRTYSSNYQYLIGKLDVSKAKFYDINENETTDLPKKKCKVFFSNELNQIFLLNEFSNTINILKELIEIKNTSILIRNFLCSKLDVNISLWGLTP